MKGFLAAPVLAAGLAIGGPALADSAFFKSPTGNIACAIFEDVGGAFARCDLQQLSFSYPRAPADCDGDWGAYFAVNATGRGAPICVGDTVRDPGAFVLGYGQSISLGGITCTSEKTGMTCVNRQGHGFSVAKAKQQVF